MRHVRTGAVRQLALLAISGVLMVSGNALAQAYPTKAVRMLVPFPPGGGSDTIARIVAQKFSEILGQQVLVDNRAGASGNIAADLTAKAVPDGYTLLFGNSSLAISPGVFSKLSYDPVRDLEGSNETLSGGIGVDLEPIAASEPPIDRREEHPRAR